MLSTEYLHKVTRNKTRDFLAPAFYLHFVYVLEKYNFLGGMFENCVRKAGGSADPKVVAEYWCCRKSAWGRLVCTKMHLFFGKIFLAVDQAQKVGPLSAQHEVIVDS